jgi:hypothetical protein
MGGVSVWQLLILFACILNAVAFWRLLPQAGISKYLSVLAFIPPIAVIFLWVIAFRTEPLRQG